MAIFRFSLLLAALTQAPPQPAPVPSGAAQNDSVLAALWESVRVDSLDGAAWLRLARAYLRRPVLDTAANRAALDTADLALARAATLTEGDLADSVSTFRLFAWGERALLAWRSGGAEAATISWGKVPEDARLPPELEELGENLLRACPERGLLITASDADTYSASYLRFARRLRPDLTVLPLDHWPAAEVDRRLKAASERQPVCASMAFERPHRGIKWQARPLVWVGGQVRSSRDRVPPEDFVFAALRIALDDSSTWTAAPVAAYRRSVKHIPALCKTFKAFEITKEVGCK